MAREAMDVCLRVLKESNKSRFDSYSRQEQCIDHIPLLPSGRAFRDCPVHIFPTTFLEIAVLIISYFNRLGDHMRDYMNRRVTPPKRVTSPTWGPPPPCKQALNRNCILL